jgi:hypothetical protein
MVRVTSSEARVKSSEARITISEIKCLVLRYGKHHVKLIETSAKERGLVLMFKMAAILTKNSEIVSFCGNSASFKLKVARYSFQKFRCLTL